MPSHQDVQSGSSRDRLLRAAKRLFAAQGYEQTATSAIAREAGTSESQLMRYFGGKAGLLEAIFEEAWADLNERVKRVIEANEDSRTTLLNVFQTITAALARDGELAKLLLLEGRRLRDGPRVRLSTGFTAFSEVARGLVRRGQVSRELDPTLDAAAVTSAIVGAAEGMIRDRLLARESGTRAVAENEIRRTLDALLLGLAPERRSRVTARSRVGGRAAKRPK
jgi:AcrR family transcriptional regulator